MDARRVIINAIPLLSPLTGIDRYTIEVVKRAPEFARDMLFHYYYGYVSKTLRHYGAGGTAVRLLSLAKIAAPRIKPLKRLFYNRVMGAAKTSDAPFDLYWASDNVPLNAIKARKLVTTVHDFSVFKYPERHPKERVAFYDKFFFNNVSRSERIIVVSEFVRGEATAEYGFDPARIRVVHNGVDHGVFRVRPPEEVAAFKARLGLDKPYFLFVGSLDPRKNLRNLIRAYQTLPVRVRNEVELVLAGPKGFKWSAVKNIAGEVSGAGVRRLGYLEDPELCLLYNGARAFAFPSIYEGFGIPPLEAMACGTPVVASKTSSIPEVCGDAAFYIDPYDTDSIADGLRRCAEEESLRAALVKKGFERTARFTWDRCSAQTFAVFREAMG